MEALVGDGCDVLVVHRGEHEPPDLPPVEHLHAERAELARHRHQLAAFAPDAAVDVSAMSGAAAGAGVDALPPGLRLVAISSMDVYRAYDSLHHDVQTDAVPLDESSPLRTRRHIDRPDTENLEVEERYGELGATVLRLGAVYGPHDHQERLELILRRVRAGRRRIPVGSGTFLFSRVFVADVASAVLLALRHDEAIGQVFNVCEAKTWPYLAFAQHILDAAGWQAELVRVDEAMLPLDLVDTVTFSQHLLGDPSKLRLTLGWEETDPVAALATSVRWHLDHPPRNRHGGGDGDFDLDERALASASGAGT